MIISLRKNFRVRYQGVHNYFSPPLLSRWTDRESRIYDNGFFWLNSFTCLNRMKNKMIRASRASAIDEAVASNSSCSLRNLRHRSSSFRNWIDFLARHCLVSPPPQPPTWLGRPLQVAPASDAYILDYLVGGRISICINSNRRVLFLFSGPSLP